MGKFFVISKKIIIQRFTEAVWDELEAELPALASFSSRTFCCLPGC